MWVSEWVSERAQASEWSEWVSERASELELNLNLYICITIFTCGIINESGTFHPLTISPLFVSPPRRFPLVVSPLVVSPLVVSPPSRFASRIYIWRKAAENLLLINNSDQQRLSLYTRKPPLCLGLVHTTFNRTVVKIFKGAWSPYHVSLRTFYP